MTVAATQITMLADCLPRTRRRLGRLVAGLPFGQGYGTFAATTWALLVSLVFAGITFDTQQARSAVLIKNDGGGDIPLYIARYVYLQARGERVVIDGDCLSACTLALGMLAKNRRCFTRKARLGFHAAWTKIGGTRLRDPVGTQILWSSYPMKVRKWISRHGGLTSKVIYLEGKELAAMYPPCRR